MPGPSFAISGNIVDVLNRRIFPGTVRVEQGRIAAIAEDNGDYDTFVLPGFVDAHIHVESSMLVPSEFARAAVVHGTVATVSDPHEIANVLGLPGVRYMLDNAAGSPFKFCFGAPSCVPATRFETAGARLDAEQVAELLRDDRIGYLSEVMDYPGVLRGDVEVLAKIDAAKRLDKPVDGHAPGLRGEDAARYVAAGISTDHECFTKDEALDKLSAGCLIAIREGSAARNFDALYTLLDEQPGKCMLCSDDRHPDALLEGHVDSLVARAVTNGIDVFHALHAACVVPVQHYELSVGLLRPGDPADFIEVDDLQAFKVRRTFIDGERVAENGDTLLPRVPTDPINHFNATPRRVEDFAVPCDGKRTRVIVPTDGQLITHCEALPAKSIDGLAVSDVERDMLKLAVVNRYADAPPAIGFVSPFGLRRGAIASSVAHDSHNIVAVGVDDDALCRAVNAVIDAGGGLSVVDGDEVDVLPLPVAGLMSDRECHEVGRAYAQLDRRAKDMGTTLAAPFMTLSFMALLVIPELKLSDRGLFDGTRFEFVPLFV